MSKIVVILAMYMEFARFYSYKLQSLSYELSEFYNLQTIVFGLQSHFFNMQIKNEIICRFQDITLKEIDNDRYHETDKNRNAKSNSNVSIK